MTSRRSTSRIRFNRALFAATPGHPVDELIETLRVEDVTLLIDARADARDVDQLAHACADSETYFARRAELAILATHPGREPDRAHAWAAHMALRHRTCVLGQKEVARAVADLVGLEVVELADAPTRTGPAER